MSRTRILLVEDEASIADTLLYALRTEGFEATWAPTGREARVALASGDYQFLVLDVGLPDANGFDLCREFRRHTDIPILFLTARQGEVDRVVGLELGADDYVTKPFSPREITARIRAILRRLNGRVQAVQAAQQGLATPAPLAPALPRPAAWQHDAERQRILREGQALELTRNEYRLLRTLLARPGRVFTREELLLAAWDEPEACSDRTVDAHIKLLRAKLRRPGENADPIETRRGLGYAFREF